MKMQSKGKDRAEPNLDHLQELIETQQWEKAKRLFPDRDDIDAYQADYEFALMVAETLRDGARLSPTKPDTSAWWPVLTLWRHQADIGGQCYQCMTANTQGLECVIAQLSNRWAWCAIGVDDDRKVVGQIQAGCCESMVAAQYMATRLAESKANSQWHEDASRELTLIDTVYGRDRGGGMKKKRREILKPKRRDERFFTWFEVE